MDFGVGPLSADHPVHLGLTGLSQIDVSPVLLATGSPGRGKSLATMMLAYHLALEGGRVMLVDPKGDPQNCLNLTGARGHLNSDPWQQSRGRP